MAVMDGWGFRAEQIRDPALARIPVVVTSALPMEELKADGYCQKPFDWESLLGAVARFVSPARGRGHDPGA